MITLLCPSLYQNRATVQTKRHQGGDSDWMLELQIRLQTDKFLLSDNQNAWIISLPSLPQLHSTFGDAAWSVVTCRMWTVSTGYWWPHQYPMAEQSLQGGSRAEVVGHRGTESGWWSWQCCLTELTKAALQMKSMLDLPKFWPVYLAFKNQNPLFRPDCPVALPYSMFFDTFASIFHNLSTCPWHVKHQTWFSLLSVQTWLLKEIAVVIVIVIVIALHLSWSLQLSLSLSDLLTTNSAISSDFLFQYIARLRSA